MKIYVLMDNQDSANTLYECIRAVFSSLELAQSIHPGAWTVRDSLPPMWVYGDDHDEYTEPDSPYILEYEVDRK